MKTYLRCGVSRNKTYRLLKKGEKKSTCNPSKQQGEPRTKVNHMKAY